MGVSGLWDLVAPAGRRVRPDSLEGRTMAVDSSLWLVQFMKAMRDSSVFVFDGPPTPLKHATLLLRAHLREQHEVKLRSAAEKLLMLRLQQRVTNAGRSKRRNTALGTRAADLHAADNSPKSANRIDVAQGGQTYVESLDDESTKPYTLTAAKSPIRYSGGISPIENFGEVDPDGAPASIKSSARRKRRKLGSKVLFNNASVTPIDGSAQLKNEASSGGESNSDGVEETDEGLVNAAAHRARRVAYYCSIPAQFTGFLSGRRRLDDIRIDESESSLLTMPSAVSIAKHLGQVATDDGDQVHPQTAKIFRDTEDFKEYRVVDEDGEERFIQLPLDAEIDPAVFKNLPPKMQYSILTQLRDAWFNYSRVRAVQAKADVAALSNIQVESFIRTVRTAKEIEKVKKTMAKELHSSVAATAEDDAAKSNHVSELMSEQNMFHASATNSNLDAPLLSLKEGEAPNLVENNFSPGRKSQRRLRSSQFPEIMEPLRGLQLLFRENPHMARSDVSFEGVPNLQESSRSTLKQNPLEIWQQIRTLSKASEQQLSAEPTISGEVDSDLQQGELMAMRVQLAEWVDDEPSGTSCSTIQTTKDNSIDGGDRGATVLASRRTPRKKISLLRKVLPDDSEGTATGNLSSKGAGYSGPILAAPSSEPTSLSHGYDPAAPGRFLKIAPRLLNRSNTPVAPVPETQDFQPIISFSDSSSDGEDQWSEWKTGQETTELITRQEMKDPIAGQETKVKTSVHGMVQKAVLSNKGLTPPSTKTQERIDEENIFLTQEKDREQAVTADREFDDTPNTESQETARGPFPQRAIAPDTKTIFESLAYVHRPPTHSAKPQKIESMAVEPIPQNAISNTTTRMINVDPAKSGEVDVEMPERFRPATAEVQENRSASPVSTRSTLRDLSAKAPLLFPTDKDKDTITEAGAVNFSLFDGYDEEALAAEEENVAAHIAAHKRGADIITPEMTEEVRELIGLFGIPFLDAPAEAEAQCAVLVQKGLCDSIISDDSDSLLFGALEIYRHFFDHRCVPELYDLEEIETQLGLTRPSMILIAMLLGCDYTVGVRGIGIVNAMETVRAFQTFEDLIKFRDWATDIVSAASSSQAGIGIKETDTLEQQIFKKEHHKYRRQWSVHDKKRFPPNFPDFEVYRSFMQPVTNQSAEIFTWGRLDIDGIMTFMLKKTGIDRKQILEHLQPVLAELQKKPVPAKQLSMRDFIAQHRLEEADRVAEIRSKRLGRAIERLRDRNRHPEAANSPNIVANQKQRKHQRQRARD